MHFKRMGSRTIYSNMTPFGSYRENAAVSHTSVNPERYLHCSALLISLAFNVLIYIYGRLLLTQQNKRDVKNDLAY